MRLTRYEFEVLSCLEKNSPVFLSLRQIADTICISVATVKECVVLLQSRKLVKIEGNGITITPEGVEALDPYCVKRAIIMAAGFGSRMMPATADRPKPMVEVNGVRIIDTLLDALVGVGIQEITIVGGYKYEKLNDLLLKYPFIKIINNMDYSTTNNISSIILAIDELHDGCYLCEADLFISNPCIITKYQYTSNILGSYSLETDDWSYRIKDGYLTDYKKGNTYCYNYYGISYWTAEDCTKLRKDFTKVFNEYEGGKNYFWEFIPFVLAKDNYKVEVRQCSKQDITEIDNYFELQQLDETYR